MIADKNYLENFYRNPLTKKLYAFVKIFTIKLHLQESEKFSFLKISIEYNVRYWRNYEEDF